MNYLDSLSQMQPSLAAAQHETDSAIVHQQPQEKNDSNVQRSPLKYRDSSTEKSVESSNILYFPLPGK